MRLLLNGNLRAGLDSVRGAKRRSFWTCLGVTIGVASVISIVAIGEGLKQQISGQIHHLGNNLITVRPSGELQTSSTNLLSGFSISGSLTAQDIAAVAKTPGLAASAPLTIAGGTISGDNGVDRSGFVIGTTPDLPSLLNQSLADGVFLGSQDVDNNVVVLGQQAAAKLFNEDVPLGRSLTFHGQQFVVEGIFNQFTTTPLSQQADLNNAVFIPNDIAESLANNTAPTYEILARPSSSNETSQVARKIQAELSTSHGGQSGFSVLTGNQNLASNNSILALLTSLTAGVAALSLLVGGIGIMNVMLVSVAERTHEIGIRKAVGATNRQILGQFMIEATLLGVVGGALGITLAYVIDGGLRLATNLQPSITWQIVVIASGVSLLVGVIFGTIPAVQAARKNPIEALRSE